MVEEKEIQEVAEPLAVTLLAIYLLGCALVAWFFIAGNLDEMLKPIERRYKNLKYWLKSKK